MREARIVVINGGLGGEQGSTAAVLGPLVEALRRRAGVTEIHLATDSRGVAALQPLLREASAFVFATGTYWDSWASPLQAFFEQATATATAAPWQGKPAAVVVTSPSPGGGALLRRLQGALRALGFQCPPMTGLAHSPAAGPARPGEAGVGLGDHRLLDDFDLVAANLLEAMRGGALARWPGPGAAAPGAPDEDLQELGARNLGTQILADLHDCEAAILDDAGRIREIMCEAARRAGAAIVSESIHHFSPHGVSGVVVIAESHLAIHTWPEHRYAALDLFTCGDTLHAGACFDYLREALACGRHRITRVGRG